MAGHMQFTKTKDAHNQTNLPTDRPDKVYYIELTLSIRRHDKWYDKCKKKSSKLNNLHLAFLLS